MTIIDRSYAELREEIEEWRAIGATHITVNTMPERWVEEEKRWNKADIGGLVDPRAHIDAIRRFRDALPDYF